MSPTMTTPAASDLLSTAQVAEMIERTPRRVHQLVHEGRLRPSAAFGNADRTLWYVFHPLEVARFLAVRDR